MNQESEFTFSLDHGIETCDETGKVYLYLKTISRSLRTRMELDEILNNEIIVDKLDKNSLKFLFHTAGFLEGVKFNDVYTIKEIDPLNPRLFTVKNTITYKMETWNVADTYNEKHYHKLDKESLFKFAELYLKFLNFASLPQNKNTLRMVKN